MDNPLQKICELNHDEQFENLQNPPVVEALIQINCPVQTSWLEQDILQALTVEVPTYTKRMNLQAAQFHLDFPALIATPPQQKDDLPHPVANARTQFEGVRVETADGKWIAQFRRECFVLSRLSPYISWQSLCDEAMRLWKIHVRLGMCKEITRISCRFINRIPVKIKPQEETRVDEYFANFGEAPKGFLYASFIHQALLMVPGQPYVVNLIRTHQPPDLSGEPFVPLILDLEAICPEHTVLDEERVRHRLADLRCVKNKVFRATVTDKLLELCR